MIQHENVSELQNFAGEKGELLTLSLKRLPVVLSILPHPLQDPKPPEKNPTTIHTSITQLVKSKSCILMIHLIVTSL
jgi:hypothetical protein